VLARRPRLTFHRPGTGFLAVPGAAFVLFFFIWPVVGIATQSVTQPSLGIDNYVAVVSSNNAIHALVLTIQTSVIVTVTCLILGYPLAYLIYVAPGPLSGVLLILTMVSMFLSQVARTFAWEVILRDTGIVNSMLQGLGLIDGPLPLIRNALGVTIGVTQVLLPTMVLPIWVVMNRIDPEFGRAAASLGASPMRSFLRVFLPLSLPGVAAGCLLVFMLALGAYVTPTMLGGGGYIMLGELIVSQVQHLQWGYGSALAVTLLVLIFAVLAVAARLVRLEDMFTSVRRG
jgi:putative spermidine/putrescine transport system permease protein